MLYCPFSRPLRARSDQNRHSGKAEKWVKNRMKRGSPQTWQSWCFLGYKKPSCSSVSIILSVTEHMCPCISFFFHKCVCLCLLAKGARSVIYHCVKSHDSDESISSLNPFQHLIIGCHLNIQFPCCMLVHVNLSQRRVCASVTLRMLCYLAQRAAFLRFKDQTNNFSLCFPPLFSGTLNCCAGKRKLKPWTPSKLDVCGWRSINE